VQALAVHRHPDEAHVGTPVVQDGALLVGLDQERVELVAPPLAPAVEPLVRHHARHEGNTERLLVHRTSQPCGGWRPTATTAVRRC